MIGIIDYNAGNLGSWKRLLSHLNVDFQLIKHTHQIDKCSKLILPGVGSFDHAVKSIEGLNIFNKIKCTVKNGKPILGVCLGMQLFAESSEEGFLTGLDLINLRVKSFHNLTSMKLKIPHVGFNKVFSSKNKTNFLSIANENDFYFVHSYAFPVVKSLVESSLICRYENIEFVAGLHIDNMYVTQFHPEKSGEIGIKLIKEFLDS